MSSKRFLTPFLPGTFGSRLATLFDWDIGFAGYRLDLNSRLYIARYRWFNPALGRWISRDSLRSLLEQSPLYCYGSNRPTVLVDPLGLQAAAVDPDKIIDQFDKTGHNECKHLFDRQGVEKEISKKKEGNRKCKSIIFAGHHFPGTEEDELDAVVEKLAEVWEDPMGGAKLPCGWTVGGVGCFINTLDKSIKRKFPEQRIHNIAAYMPSKYFADRDKTGTLLKAYAREALSLAFAKAREEAERTCRDHRQCCASVMILVCCTDEYRKAIGKDQEWLCDNNERAGVEYGDRRNWRSCQGTRLPTKNGAVVSPPL